MIKILLAVCLMSISMMTCAASVISAITFGEQGYPLNSHAMIKDAVANRPLKDVYFPEKHYTVKNVYLHNLKWVRGKENTKNILSLPGEYNISTSGSLDLEYYDPETGRYRYKLTITPEKIIDYKMAMATGLKISPITPLGNAIFQENNKTFMYIEGIANIYKGKLNLSNIHTNKDNSSFAFTTDKNNTLIVMNLVDTPVLIELND